MLRSLGTFRLYYTLTMTELTKRQKLLSLTNSNTIDTPIYDSESSHESTDNSNMSSTNVPNTPQSSIFSHMMNAATQYKSMSHSPAKKNSKSNNTISAMFSKQQSQPSYSSTSKFNATTPSTALNDIDTNIDTTVTNHNNTIKSPTKSPVKTPTKSSTISKSSITIPIVKKRKIIPDDADEIETESVHNLHEQHSKSHDHDNANESPNVSDADDDNDTDNVIGVVPTVESSSDDIYRWGTANYDPIQSATWRNDKDKFGECSVPYSVFAELCTRAEAESSRLIMIAMVCDFLRSVIAVSPQDLVYIVYLLINKVAPDYSGKEIGIGDGVIKKVLQASTGKSLAVLDSMLNDIGDLGLVAMQCRTSQVTLFKPKPLKCVNVYKSLYQLTELSGKGTQGEKVKLLQNLIVSCIGDEAKYLVRSLQGNLRVGFSEKTVIAALARAVVLGNNIVSNNKLTKLAPELLQAKQSLDQVYIELPNHDIVIKKLLQYGIDHIAEHCYLQPGVPVKCMLGKACKSVDEIFTQFENQLFTVEWKYDGERAQIHLTDTGDIMIYSRNSENHTQKYPDIIEYLPRVYQSHSIKSFILDCEVVAYDTKLNKIMPFQQLSHRKRKDVKSSDITVQVCLYAFDLLYLNGESLLSHTLQNRRELLYSNFEILEHQFYYAEKRDTDDLNEVTDFLNQAVSGSCEGLMVKSLVHDSMYVPAKRNWLKLKKDYLDGVGDSLDLVVIGAWYGRGKRTGVYGAFLLACYDSDNEEYQAITKLGTGFSEDMLESVSKKLNELIIDKPLNYVKYAIKPDVYFSTKLVWEVKCADISASPVYQAGIGVVHPEKGIALRFPRFIRERDDKNAENATSTEQVIEMYENQDNRQ